MAGSNMFYGVIQHSLWSVEVSVSAQILNVISDHSSPRTGWWLFARVLDSGAWPGVRSDRRTADGDEHQWAWFIRFLSIFFSESQEKGHVSETKVQSREHRHEARRYQGESSSSLRLPRLTSSLSVFPSSFAIHHAFHSHFSTQIRRIIRSDSEFLTPFVTIGLCGSSMSLPLLYAVHCNSYTRSD